jgi:hypothetical protein
MRNAKRVTKHVIASRRRGNPKLRKLWSSEIASVALLPRNDNRIIMHFEFINHFTPYEILIINIIIYTIYKQRIKRYSNTGRMPHHLCR